MKIFKRALSILLRVSISVILLYFLFKQIDKKSLIEAIKNARYELLFLAFFIFFGIYVLALFRWEMLLKTAKIHLSLKRVIISFSGGVFFSLVLPSTIGGDFVRSIDLAIHTRRPHKVVATVLLDRLSGYIGLVFVALLAVALNWGLTKDKSILPPVVIITLILIAILLVLFNKFLYSKINKLLHSPHLHTHDRSFSVFDKIRESMRNLHQEMHIFRHHKAVIVDNLILSVGIQLLLPLTFYITALSLGLKIDMIYFFIFIPIICAITLLPISIGGLGLRDALTVFYFAKIGVSKNLAFAMSLLNFFFLLVCAGTGGLIYVLTLHHRRLQHH